MLPCTAMHCHALPCSSSSSCSPKVLTMMMKAALVAALLALPPGTAGLDNGVGRTPPMGWNSWDDSRCSINASSIIATAAQMKALGLVALGCEYLNLDDCWSANARDNATGELVVDVRTFPDGIKSVTDAVHAAGMKFGICKCLPCLSANL